MSRAIGVFSSLLLLVSAGVAAQEVEGASTSAGADYLPLVILLVAFGAIFYFMLIRPQRKRQQQMNDLMGGLKRGDMVTTAGGIFGEIDSIGDTSVVLILEEGGKIRIAKTSIVRKRDK